MFVLLTNLCFVGLQKEDKEILLIVNQVQYGRYCKQKPKQ